MRLFISQLIVSGLLFSLLSGPAAAGEKSVSVEFGTTVVGQQISKRNGDINKPLAASTDLVIDADLGFGSLHLYGEAASSASTSAPTLIAGSNADAGTAASPAGRGRVQLSEISFGTEVGVLALNAGVMDLTGFTDATGTANDEGEQFLAGVLINNPTIAFPDYTPALVFGFGEDEGVQFTALVANAYGLGDNPRGNYSQLFQFGRTPTGEKKGLFSLAEVRMPVMNSGLLTIGGWHSSMEVARLSGSGNDQSTIGGYVNLDGTIGAAAWSARIGFNNAKSDMTSGVRGFFSLSGEHEVSAGHTFGIGAAYSALRGDYKASLAPNTGANTTVAELYYRWQITDELAVSPDVQYHHNANNLSAASTTNLFGGVWVYGLRVQFGIGVSN